MQQQQQQKRLLSVWTKLLAWGLLRLFPKCFIKWFCIWQADTQVFPLHMRSSNTAAEFKYNNWYVAATTCVSEATVIHSFSNACNLLIAGYIWQYFIDRSFRGNFFCMRVYQLVSLHLWFCMRHGRGNAVCMCELFWMNKRGREMPFTFHSWLGTMEMRLPVGVCVCMCVCWRGLRRWEINELQMRRNSSCSTAGFRIACLLAWPWQPGEWLPRVSVQCPSYATHEPCTGLPYCTLAIRGHSVLPTQHSCFDQKLFLWLHVNNLYKQKFS